MKIKSNNFIGIIFILFILSCANNLNKVSDLDNGKDDSISSEKNENNKKYQTPTITPTATLVPTITPTATFVPAIIEIINISNFKFEKESLNIIVGSTVLWINNDSSSHTVSSSDNIFSSGFLSSGQKYQFTFLSSGRYSYKCDLHSNMKGIIKVISTKND